MILLCKWQSLQAWPGVTNGKIQALVAPHPAHNPGDNDSGIKGDNTVWVTRRTQIGNSQQLLLLKPRLIEFRPACLCYSDAVCYHSGHTDMIKAWKSLWPACYSNAFGNVGLIVPYACNTNINFMQGKIIHQFDRVCKS